MTIILAITWPVVVLGIFFLVVCTLKVLVILAQRPRGGGLSGAFGGAGGGAQSAFGAKVGDALTVFTVGMFVLFILLAMGMQWAIKSEVPDGTDQPAATESATETPADETVVSPDTAAPSAESGAVQPSAEDVPSDPASDDPQTESAPTKPAVSDP